MEYFVYIHRLDVININVLFIIGNRKIDFGYYFMSSYAKHVNMAKLIGRPHSSKFLFNHHLYRYLVLS